jgi:hypothetical protein
MLQGDRPAVVIPGAAANRSSVGGHRPAGSDVIWAA